MVNRHDEVLERIQQDGFAVLPGVFAADQVENILRELSQRWQTEPGGIIRGRGGSISGARNLLQLWPRVAQIWKQAPLPEILARTLGPDFGLVRVLYFDKPPDQAWALPWHKDMTIAVKNNTLPSRHFAKPTRKAG